MEILDQFGIKPILLAAQVVNFLILLFILKRFLYKPILKVLEARKKTIEQSLKNAEEIENRLLQISDLEEERLQKAALESEKILKSAEDSATQIIEEGKKRAEEVSVRLIEEAKGQIHLEREKLQQEVRSELTSVVTLVLQKVTGKVLTKDDQKKIIDQQIKQLS